MSEPGFAAARGGGRFELGIGWGSVAGELGTFGVGSQEPKVRLNRLRESLEIIDALWTGETLDYEGEHFSLHGAQQVPGPLGHIPIVIGGAGKGTMRLVAEYADWWNVPTGEMEKLETMRERAGSARPSVQEMVTLAPDDGSADDVVELARRRFGGRTWPRGAVGPTGALIEHFGQIADLANMGAGPN